MRTSFITGYVSLLLFLSAATGCLSRPETDYQPGFRNIILISIDTLRAEYLGSYGFPGGLSPNLDQFASRSIVFEQAISSAPWTKPSVASLFTGMHATAHGVTNLYTAPGHYGRDRLPDEFVTIAEVFRNAGFRTGGFSGNLMISRRFGFDQGFEIFKGPVRYKDYPDITITDNALAWIDGTAGAPFFLYVHYMDVHNPYRFDQSDYQELFDNPALGQSQPIPLNQTPVTEEFFHPPAWMPGEALQDIKTFRTSYAAGIRAFDRVFARMMDSLEARGYFRNSLIIVTADHGEGFLEHGKLGHGSTLYQELIRVPLFVYLPDQSGRGRRVSMPVAQIDLVPALLSLAGIKTALSGQLRSVQDGVDLFPVITGTATVPSSDRLILSSAQMMQSEPYAVIGSQYKVFDQGNGAGPYLIYDLLHDPQEHENLYSAGDSRSESLVAEARRIRQFSQLREVKPGPRIEPKAAEIKELKSLGYLAK